MPEEPLSRPRRVHTHDVIDLDDPVNQPVPARPRRLRQPADAVLPLFEFESDYAKSLCCMPIIVRYKLDACRIKLSLQGWQCLDRATRTLLIIEDVDGTGAQRRYRHLLVHAIVHQAKIQPVRMPARHLESGWDCVVLPDRVRQSALDKSLPLNGRRSWADLNALQRFALFKLTRPGHENCNFSRALREFGLTAS